MTYEDVIEERDGFRVKLVAMEAPENPREDGDYHLAGVVTLHNGYGHSRYIDTADPAGDERIQRAWSRLTGSDAVPYRWDKAADILARYIRILGGVSELETPHDGANNLWYVVPGPRWDEAMAGEPFDADRAREVIKAERGEYRSWCEGDVWGYVVQKRTTWVPKGHPDAPEELVTWEEEDSTWGYIGREYAETEARMALSSALGETAGASDAQTE